MTSPSRTPDVLSAGDEIHEVVAPMTIHVGPLTESMVAETRAWCISRGDASRPPNLACHDVLCVWIRGCCRGLFGRYRRAFDGGGRAERPAHGSRGCGGDPHGGGYQRRDWLRR